MNKSYHRKLFAAFLATILVLLVLLSGLGYFQFTTYYLHNLESRLAKEAYLTADMARYRTQADGVKRSYQDICLTAARDALTRVTIIDSQGIVLGDSEVSPGQLDNHSSRPEVYAALHGETGVEIRYSDTLDMNMLYVAVPFSDGENSGAVRMAMPLADLQDIYKNALLGILGIGLGCGILALILSFLVIPYFSRPILEIAAAVQDMAGGNYSRRISVHSDDELGVLAHAFNNMGQHIEQNLHQISEVKNRLEAILSNTVNGIMLIGHDGRLIYANPAAVALLGLGEDFIGRNYTESIAAYELLCMIDEAKVSLQPIKRSIVLHTRGGNIAEANVVPIINNGVSSQDILLVLNDITEMKRLEQVRKDFVANVSHELKTPVSAISGFAETLLDEGISDQFNAVEFTRIIYDEAQRLTHLINSLLTLSKLESEPVSLNMQIIDLNSLMATTAARMNNLAGLKNITINYYDRGEAVNLKSDPELIEQIMINLLDNAIKYSSEGNIIELILEESADRVIIKVKDHGTGIPAAELPRIFERFYRVDKARSRKTGGSGLGLAIVKHLVENLHGQIAVESTIGTGTVFSVTLFKQ